MHAKRYLPGFSLIELAMAFVVIALVTISASQLLLASTQTQLQEGLHANHVGTLSSVVSQIRSDMQRSSAVTVNGSAVSPAQGNLLSFTLNSGGTVSYQYDPANMTITRNQSGNPALDYRSLMPQRLQGTTTIACSNPCFNLQSTTQVSIFNLSIADTSPTNSAFDQTFGNAGFRIPEVIVNKMAGFTFQ